MADFKSHAPGSFCLFELSTTDQKGAKAFYASLFGWAAADNPIGPSDFYTMFSIEGRDVAAAMTQRKEQTDAGFPPYWDLYVSVASADQTTARAMELGGKVIKAPFDVFNYGRMAVIGDPTGAVFCIWQAKTHIGIGKKNEPGGFCWVDLVTPDPDTAARFYMGLFDWTMLPGEGGYLHLKNGEDFIGGIRKADAGACAHWLSYIQVTDCDGTTAKARELGARVCMDPTTVGNVGRMSVISDPQGAVFALFENSHGQ